MPGVHGLFELSQALQDPGVPGHDIRPIRLLRTSGSCDLSVPVVPGRGKGQDTRKASCEGDLTKRLLQRRQILLELLQTQYWYRTAVWRRGLGDVTFIGKLLPVRQCGRALLHRGVVWKKCHSQQPSRILIGPPVDLRNRNPGNLIARGRDRRDCRDFASAQCGVVTYLVDLVHSAPLKACEFGQVNPPPVAHLLFAEVRHHPQFLCDDQEVDEAEGWEVLTAVRRVVLAGAEHAKDGAT